MSVIIQTEISAALNSHRLLSHHGWREEHGVLTYTCACGYTFPFDPRSTCSKTPAALLADHQAAIIEQMGFSRSSDSFDNVALEEIANLLVRRKDFVDRGILDAEHNDGALERQRLTGARSELSILLDAVGRLAAIRAVDGSVELAIGDRSAALV